MNSLIPPLTLNLCHKIAAAVHIVPRMAGVAGSCLTGVDGGVTNFKTPNLPLQNSDTNIASLQNKTNPQSLTTHPLTMLSLSASFA